MFPTADCGAGGVHSLIFQRNARVGYILPMAYIYAIIGVTLCDKALHFGMLEKVMLTLILYLQAFKHDSWGVRVDSYLAMTDTTVERCSPEPSQHFAVTHTTLVRNDDRK